MKNMIAVILGLSFLLFQTAVPAGAVGYGVETGLPDWNTSAAPANEISAAPANGISAAPANEISAVEIVLTHVLDDPRPGIVVVTTHLHVGFKIYGSSMLKLIPV